MTKTNIIAIGSAPLVCPVSREELQAYPLAFVFFHFNQPENVIYGNPIIEEFIGVIGLN